MKTMKIKEQAVWKYQLPLQNEFSLELPNGWKPAYVGVQDQIPTLWALVDPDQGQQTYEFEWQDTGEKSPISSYRYLGTVIVHRGDLVKHLFLNEEE